jgi:hypothetical protein
MGFNIDLQTVQKGFKDGFEIASQKGGEGWNKATQKGGEWLKKAIDVLKTGNDRAIPYLQKNQVVAAAAFFCATLIILELSIRLGSLASKAIAKESKVLRQQVDTSLTIIFGVLFSTALITYVNRANLPLSWFSMSVLALIAFGLRGSYELDSVQPNT